MVLLKWAWNLLSTLEQTLWDSGIVVTDTSHPLKAKQAEAQRACPH